MIPPKKTNPLHSLHALHSQSIGVIIGCSGKKKDISKGQTIPADKLYIGQLYKRLRQFITKNNFNFIILSAKLGFLSPVEQIHTYNQALGNKKKEIKKDLIRIRENKNSHKTVTEFIQNHDIIVSIMSQKYTNILKTLYYSPKIVYGYDPNGVGGFNQLAVKLFEFSHHQTRKFFTSSIIKFNRFDVIKFGNSIISRNSLFYFLVS